MQKMLVDGYNVMHKMNALKYELRENLEGARETFIRLIEEKVKEGSINTRVVVVFDGKHDETGAHGYTLEHGKIKVMFSRAPQNADTLLTQLMDEERAPQNVLVVSSDNDVLYSAKCRRIKTQQSSEFILKLLEKQKLGKNKKEHPAMSSGEMDYWLKVFRKKT